MKTFELNQFVRDHSDTHRLYPWRDVERMREDLARVSAELSAMKAFNSKEKFKRKDEHPREIVGVEPPPGLTGASLCSAQSAPDAKDKGDNATRQRNGRP